MTGEARPVAAQLAREVAARRLEFDAAQQAAAARLDALAANLAEYDRSAGIWRRLGLHGQRLSGFGQRAAWPAQRGLYLWGEVGRGKTHLMDLFYNSLKFPQRERQHFYRFMRHIHAQLRNVERRTQPLEVVAQRLAKHTRVLCLDEFFVADIADAMILAGLFEGLFRRGVTLVTSSNLPPQDLYKDGLQRSRFLPAIDLLQKHLEVVHLDGPIDYRLRQLETAPTYWDSKLADSLGQMRRRFDALAGHSSALSAPIKVEGRSIPVVCVGPGMVWFEFSELCEGPRSQNDYIELARLYHTLFISNIPQFDPYNEDAARRLVMLIDELYDRGVKTLVSAVEQPAMLYRGERLKFEFQRVASRLVEMQTKHYLARPHRP